uniref:Uncharacterized protein n=1 Tax=Strigamia maritima TaxID=126957 RepID=T1J234_STRMM
MHITMAYFNENKINYIKLKYVLIPRASNILRELFRKKWHTAGNSSWLETDEQGQQFVEGSGRNIFVTASRRRKILLRSGRIDLWDLQLLSTVLLTFDFGNNASLTKREKKAIKSLAVIYSDFRRSLNWINREEFDTAWENIAKILVKLGDFSDQLRILKLDKVGSMEMDKLSLISSSAVELRNLGNTFFKEHNFFDAIAIYSQIIPRQRCKIESAILYSNRSAAYLAIPNDILLYNQKQERAKHDIKNAIELCPTWYKAHYRMGCFYEQINNNKKAVSHYEIASILDPSKIEISNKLEKVKAFIKPEINVEQIRTEDFMASDIENRIRGGSHWTAWKGYCYLKGLQVERDYKLAAELFTEAVNDNNIFAMVQLASMYLLGRGVKKDMKMHVQLILKVASLPHIQMNGQINIDVVQAELLLGFAYHKGIGWFSDMEKAIMWYKKASEHGCGQSLHKLGNLYSKGTGVEKDEEKAVYYWQLAADRGFVEACRTLAGYYLSHEFDPDKAMQWHRRFVTESKNLAESTDRNFEVNVSALRQRIDISRICEWEAEKGVATEDLSLRDRRRLFVKRNTPNFEEFERLCFVTCNEPIENMSMETITDEDLIIDHYSYPFKLNMFKEFTSNTAKRIHQAVFHFSKAVRYVKSEKLELTIDFVKELSNCLKVEPLVAHWDEYDRKIAISIVDNIWYNVMMQRYYANSHFEVQVVICYVYFHITSFVAMKKLLKRNIEKHSNEFYFYRMYLSTLLALEDYEEGVKQAELALKIFPNNCELLLGRAKHVQGLGKNTSQVIKAYKDFLSVAEPDHPEVPAVYYEMALAYSNLKMLHQSSVTSGKVKEYYYKGLEAEKIQLPCFLPYKQNDRFEILSKIIYGIYMKCEAGNKSFREELMKSFPLVNVNTAIDDIVAKPLLNGCTGEENLNKARENNLGKNLPVAKRKNRRKRKEKIKI